ncbi:hypothetical protein [Salmonirosea aquatica]|uniref:Uncharacterized protein n=1 Tax=Salmonirosea aquatica TaxID=2654236 RepID=A0A7C9FWV2_9BACT|nr:hypothetical protein [Cytophagaceae bacterium SJW1-29]
METDGYLRELKLEINGLLGSEKSPNSLTNPNIYIKYQRLCEKLNAIEHDRVQVLVKFDNTGQYFSDLIRDLTQNQFKVSMSSIMVATIRSNRDYFWADVGCKLIGVPNGEEWHLTSLPDLAHEIGHFVFDFNSDNNWIVGNISQDISEVFQKEMIEVEDNTRRSQELLELLPKWMSLWKKTWLIEFTCDMLAIYFVGPAYAWTNLKIASSDPPKDIYNIDKPTHPSHESRMRAINEMLRVMEMGDEADLILDSWNGLLSLPIYTEPNHYQLVFPDVILQHLAFNVYQGCQNLGFSPYPEQVEKLSFSMSKLMNEAWDVLRSEPSNFQTWEKEKILALHSHFNYFP